MPPNLSYVQRELNKLRKEAADATQEMLKLERALQAVITASVKGGGTPNTGAIQRNVVTSLSSGLSPAGSPVGNRAIIGSGVNAQFQGILKAYQQQQTLLNLVNRQMQALQSSAGALAAAQQNQTGILFSQNQINQRQNQVAQQNQYATQIATQLTQRQNQFRQQLVNASRSGLQARLGYTQALQQGTNVQNRINQTLGALSGTGATPSGPSTLPQGGGGGRQQQQQQPVYTQATIQRLFPGQAGQNILQTASDAGFRPEQIKRITEYANAYTQLQFEAKGADDVMRKLVLTTDRAGNVFTSTQKQFRTFFSSIRRNIGEMVKWSAATLLVWGSIRKLSDLMQIAIDNESKLASIAVILGEEHADLTQVFNSAAEAAAATGESIDGVLEGYVQAYRATGNITDETERATQAQALLTDALTLSKLSALSTSEAMDTLSGALRQVGLNFDEGYKLLDKWVAVSRNANVGIETLAESFAITATSASNAGLSFDDLNGVIATLAESTTLSATESGNAVRAFISGFTTDTAQKELSKFGIAVTDSTGESRGFLDVMKEISALFEQGIISESELNKISRAIGGGARREAQVATTIKNLGRAQEVSEISAKANGDAQRALAVQLDTVQTAITKLNNAFQKLARTMGSEGGVLELAGGILDIFTRMVDATSSLVSNLGDMTPILAGMALVFAATSKETRGLFATNIASTVGGVVNRFAGGRGAASIEDLRLQSLAQGGGGAYNPADVPLGGRITNGLLAPGYGRNAGSRLGQGLAGGFTLISAARDLAQGNKSGAAGSIVGGIIGGLVSGGSPVGIVIGTAAGEAFANATFGYQAQFENFFVDIFDKAGAAGGAAAAGATDEETASRNLFAEYGFGSEALGGFIATTISTLLNVGYQGGQVLGNITGGVDASKLLGRDYKFKAGLPGARITPEQLALYGTGGTPQAAEIFRLQQIQAAQAGFQAGEKPGAFQFAVTDEQERLLGEYEQFLADLEKTQADIFRASAIAGEISDKDLRDALDKIPNLQAILTKYEVAFGDEIRKVNDDVGTVTDSFEYWTNIVVNGSTEQIAHLNAVADEIATIYNLIELAQSEGKGTIALGRDDPETATDEREIISIAEAYNRIAEAQQNVGIEAQSMSRAINQARIDIPSIVNLDVNEEDFDMILQYAETIQDRFWEGFWSEGILTDFTEADLEETLAPFMLKAGQDGGMKYVEGFNQSLIQQAASELIQKGLIEEVKPADRTGLQTFDIPSSQLPSVMARYQQLVNITGQAGYVPDEETFAALFTDYIAMPITADLTLLNIAMQELIDVNKKELDGIYNLPTDASFYVPFTGYQLGFVNQGGGGGAGLAGLGAGNTPEEEAAARGGPPASRATHPRVRGRYRVPIGRVIDAKVEEVVEEVIATTPVSDQMADLSKYNDARKAQALAGTPQEGITLERPDVVRQDWLENLFRQGYEAIKPDAPLAPLEGGTFGTEILNTFRELVNSLFGLNGEDSTITTKLQIESTTNTIVQLDGQVIANAIKPYLLNDEVRYEGTAGSAVKRFVI